MDNVGAERDLGSYKERESELHAICACGNELTGNWSSGQRQTMAIATQKQVCGPQQKPHYHCVARKAILTFSE